MIAAPLPDDLAPLATLHAASLPRSLLSTLGRDALTRYYTYVVTTTTEVVRVARVDGVVVGGCVLSHAPDTLLARFAAHAPLRLAGELARELATSPQLRRRFWSRLRERHGDPSAAPEVVQIFTAEALRGRGIGSQLLRACEASLRRSGTSAYTIRTHREDNEAGIRFYRREGFAPAGESTSFGDHFVVMKKALH